MNDTIKIHITALRRSFAQAQMSMDAIESLLARDEARDACNSRLLDEGVEPATGVLVAGIIRSPGPPASDDTPIEPERQVGTDEVSKFLEGREVRQETAEEKRAREASIAEIMEQRGRGHSIPFDRVVGDLRNLAPGTTVEFSMREHPLERITVPFGTDLSAYPEADRDLIRFEGDPEVGPAITRKYSPQHGIEIVHPEVDLSRLPPEDQEVFAGYRSGISKFAGIGDVEAYEREFGDAEIMAALEESNPEEMPEEDEEARERSKRISRVAGASMSVRTSKGTPGFRRSGK